MTVADLEQSVRDSLREAGLLQYLEEQETQFLEFPDGWFAEVVVRDGSKLREVEKIVEGFKTDLKHHGIELDEIVRPLWQVTKVERLGPSVSFPGLEPAVRFAITLQSGSLTCNVTVDVTEAALGMIRERLKETKAPEDAALQEIVTEFMKMQLWHGGTSYWDPRRDSRLELDAGALMYLFGRRDAFKRLKEGIDDIFGGRTEDQILGTGTGARTQAQTRKEQIRAFVQTIEFAGVKARDFENALLYLPGPGGPFRPGQKLPTSNRELYVTLFDDEKDDLRSYYLKQVDAAEEDYPELRNEFPKVFR